MTSDSRKKKKALKSNPRTLNQGYDELGRTFWTDSVMGTQEIRGVKSAVAGVSRCFWCERPVGWQKVHDSCWDEF